MSALDLEALAPPGVGRTVLGNVKAVGMLADMIEGKAGLRRGDRLPAERATAQWVKSSDPPAIAPKLSRS